MYPSLRPGRFAAVVISALTLTGCASMQVNSFVERGIDFTQYHTYAWATNDQLVTGDPRLDNNPFFLERLQASVERQLATKGFEKTTSGTPELVLHYHASITQRIDVNRVDREYGYCYDEDCRARVTEYEAGTLVLDIVDARTNRVIWRGWAQDSVEGVLDNQDRMARKIDEAVKRMLERLPRGL